VAASRDEIEQLYRERYRGFRRVLASVSGSYDGAQDIVQEAFARALRRRRDFRGDAPLAVWVWRIALRVALDERSLARWLPLEESLESALVDPTHDPELSAAVGALPPRRRLVFFLRYFADLSYQEIGAICGISEGTVAATLAQARSEVAAALAEESVSR
jgi:RNA polymerase sigma-70 factor (ECF subfamily)